MVLRFFGLPRFLRSLGFLGGVLFCLISLISLGAVLTGQSSESSSFTAEQAYMPRLTARPEFLALINNREAMSWQQLLDLSLEASGVPEKDYNRYRARVRGYLQDLQKLASPLSSDYEIGETVLDYMFGFLTRYEAMQTRMDVMFQKGTYNCVSSALLYAILARGLGLQAMGVGTYDHAFVDLKLSDGRHIDVETTNHYGFDPGTKKEFINSFTSTTGIVYVPKKNYRRRDSLSDESFIGLVLQNRLYIMNKNSHNFRVLQQMIPLAADLATLSQDKVHIQNFFSMVSQYSFNLSKSGKVEPALALAEKTLGLYGERQSLLKVRNTIAYNDILKYINAGKFSEVEQRLQKYRGVLFGKNYQILASLSSQNQVANIVNSKQVEFEDKLAAVQKAGKAVPKDKLQELYQVIYNNEINARLRSSSFSEAFALLESYPNSLKRSRFYLKLQKLAEDAYAVDFYNRSADLVNGGNYKQAQKLISQGLRRFPKNSRLLQLQRKIAQYM